MLIPPTVQVLEVSHDSPFSSSLLDDNVKFGFPKDDFLTENQPPSVRKEGSVRKLTTLLRVGVIPSVIRHEFQMVKFTFRVDFLS